MTTSALSLQALAVEFPALDGMHPNRTPFQGILTRVDEPSDRPPSGAQGHRVLVPHQVAEAALPTLLGMAVNMAGNLKDHAAQHKVGVITEAWLQGSALCVAGYLFAKDFPREVQRLRAASKTGTMGMSFEITDVCVADVHATIWELTQLTFTGAAILQRVSAAYERTELIAARRATEEESMAKSKTDTAVSAAASAVDTIAAQDAAVSSSLVGETASAVDATTTLSAAEVSATPALTADAHAQATLDSLYDSMQRFAGLAECCNAVFEAMDRLAGMQGALESIVVAVETLARCSTKIDSAAAPVAAIEETITMSSAVETLSAVEATASADGTVSASEARTVSATSVEDRLASIEAAVALLTDQTATLTGLLTDTQAPRSGLATDTATVQAQAPSALSAVAMSAAAVTSTVSLASTPVQRTTIAASGEYEKTVAKYFEEGQAVTVEQVDAKLREAGITDVTQRIAIKNLLIEDGRL